MSLLTRLLPPIIIISSLASTLPLSEENQADTAQADLSYLGARVFTQPDPETGKKLENWTETSDQNPEELGEYAEGDIVFPKRGRNGLVGATYRWKNGVVPYEIAGNFPAKDLEVIHRAMGIYKKYTCITFRPRVSADEDYISIVNGKSGCWSSVGRIKGKQKVNLQSPSCTTKIGTALHELMHVVGFVHEQTRHERDDYVTIAWQNIKKGHEANFNKAEKGDVDGFGVPYDFMSVMHYSNKAFSANGQETIIPKDSTKAKKMGQRDGFSKGDISKINAMYNCPDKTLEVTKGNVSTEVTDNEIGPETSSNPFIDAATGLFSFLFNK